MMLDYRPVERGRLRRARNVRRERLAQNAVGGVRRLTAFAGMSLDVRGDNVPISISASAGDTVSCRIAHVSAQNRARFRQIDMARSLVAPGSVGNISDLAERFI